ncbi:MAG: hypothetical protein R3349_10840 [Geminicoccaceae bacterium]|nr:hypothetical protein [Geminicoccaceae bacterium]
MRLLPDTHCLMWSMDAPERLPERVGALLADPGTATRSIGC